MSNIGRKQGTFVIYDNIYARWCFDLPSNTKANTELFVPKIFLNHVVWTTNSCKHLCMSPQQVLAAEIVRYQFPKLVDLHNYNAASSLDKKITNWSLLNRYIVMLHSQDDMDIASAPAI